MLRNVLWVLLETPSASLADIPRLLADRNYRHTLPGQVTNEEVVGFWENEYERCSPAFRAVVVAPLQNKIGGFLTDPRLGEILAAERSSFGLQSLIDEGGILLVNLSRGEIVATGRFRASRYRPAHPEHGRSLSGEHRCVGRVHEQQRARRPLFLEWIE